MANRININSEELKDRLVAINRVTKVTKGGRTFSFSAIVVVGNGNGVIGYGLGKAGEVTAAIAKGVESAKKNLYKVPIVNGTVPHEQTAHFGGSEVLIMPASQGTGVVAGGANACCIRECGSKRCIGKVKRFIKRSQLSKGNDFSIKRNARRTYCCTNARNIYRKSI